MWHIRRALLLAHNCTVYPVTSSNAYFTYAYMHTHALLYMQLVGFPVKLMVLKAATTGMANIFALKICIGM